MANFLRQIRQARWLKYPDLQWLPPGELQGDSFLDLQTTSNTLSVYAINGDTDKDRVTSALAANRDNASTFDYAVFDDAGFAALGIVAEPYEGTTLDVGVNQMHYHLINLTVGGLTGLARLVSEVEHFRIMPKQVASLVRATVAAGNVPVAKLKPDLRASIQ